MKYIVMLGDGMSDLKIDRIGNKTPLDVAKKPNIDNLAKKGIVGTAQTVPASLLPGSDVANLSAMGYNPLDCYTGRSPLEAVSIGIDLKEKDICFRCNLVTLSDHANYNDKIMLDYGADEITTEEAAILIKAVDEALRTDVLNFFPGISYRHCMVIDEYEKNLGLIPPHDISDKPIKGHLPKKQLLLDLMEKSYDILKDHPVNLKRVEKGLNPANSIWLWGEGTKPQVPNYYEKYSLKGGVISAVDLIKGIGICAGMEIIEVEGATGNVHTNFDGKCQAAIDFLKAGNDFIYIHVEAPDECGHRGELENKIKSIELIDEKIVGPLTRALDDAKEDFSIIVMPDHATPIATKTHNRDAVPFLIYRSNEVLDNPDNVYNEDCCKAANRHVENAFELMDILVFNKKI